ncbi:hypothetical protein E4T66_12370 [Sinimarinibacterium sp. CAU 1509]|uniref:hypothetical protein n=1 Tax=Sinimarinibacterium sp. CAU 1509 TaxID=2562283 RepID=UPI0010AD0C97|nr:hypothetical protein [Sinimarinibacterium sp. CAU 1509]TJY59970.1 hypothetical protein E4T66_12370 [Sinimarinibacterium sp. CAU 1509]
MFKSALIGGAVLAATLASAPASAALPTIKLGKAQVTAEVATATSEEYAIVPGVTSHLCYPDGEPVPGRVCAAEDQVRTDQPGTLIAAHSDIQPPVYNGTTLVESDSTAFQDLQTNCLGYLTHAGISVQGLSHVAGPNSGTIRDTHSGLIAVDFNTLNVLSPTVVRITGNLRVRATDPVNPYFTPPYKPASASVVIELKRIAVVGNPDEVIFTRTVSTEASGGVFIDVPLQEVLSIANGNYRLTIRSSGSVFHNGAAYAAIGYNQHSAAETDVDLDLSLENRLLGLVP